MAANGTTAIRLRSLCSLASSRNAAPDRHSSYSSSPDRCRAGSIASCRMRTTLISRSSARSTTRNRMKCRASTVSRDVQRPIPCADFLTPSRADDIWTGLQGLQCIPEKLAVGIACAAPNCRVVQRTISRRSASAASESSTSQSAEVITTDQRFPLRSGNQENPATRRRF